MFLPCLPGAGRKLLKAVLFAMVKTGINPNIDEGAGRDSDEINVSVVE